MHGHGAGAGRHSRERTDERLLAVVSVDATGLLVELADPFFAVQHADELDL